MGTVLVYRDQRRSRGCIRIVYFRILYIVIVYARYIYENKIHEYISEMSITVYIERSQLYISQISVLHSN